MKRGRKVKIIATLGPASGQEDMIERLFLAGADVFRINMSHTAPARLHEIVAMIRQVEQRLGRPISILADLQGPKLRIGAFKAGKVEIKKNQSFILDSAPELGDETRVHLPHREIFRALKPQDRILIDDGRVSLVVTSCQENQIITRVLNDGMLSDRKGVSLPDTILPLSAMTPKDHADLAAIMKEPVDWVALSFIQRPEDVSEVRKIVGQRFAIMSKIEKPQALARLNEIIDLSDGVMVARGDLGVEMALETVPSTQIDIIEACRAAGKPVVVATQMLESMISAAVPTRAEVSDVATAVNEGADAIMLSAESASGQFPEEAVAMMDQIARSTESSTRYRQLLHAQQLNPEPTGADAISLAARQIGKTLNVSAIIAYTSSGATGIRMSRARPLTPLVALSPKIETLRRLAVVWGLHCVLSQDATSLEDMVERAGRIAYEEEFAKAGERILITAGVPLGTSGATNLLRIAFVSGDGQRAI